METEITSKPCCACASEIPATAKKCVKCGSPQDWQRFLNLSSTTLSLIIALISVLTVAVPTVKGHLLPKKAKPIVTYMAPGPDGLSFMATISNAGNQALVVKSGSIEIGDMWVGTNVSFEGEGQRVVKPNDIVIAHFSPWRDDEAHRPMIQKAIGLAAKGCDLSVNMLEVDGRVSTVKRPMNAELCQSALMVVDSTFDQNEK